MFDGDVLLGRTPLELNGREPHRLVLRKEGYREREVALPRADTRQTLSFVLDPRP